MKLLLIAICLFGMNVARAQSALTVSDVSETALTIGSSYANTVAGMYFPNAGGDVMVAIRNFESADSATVTFTVQDASIEVPGYGPLTKSSLAVAVTAGQTKIVGPFKTGPWNDSNERVQMTFSGSGTDVVVLPFRIAPSLR